MSVTGTYRLQMHEGFGFAHAVAIVPYLARLGVSHVYLSPILQAASGSMHGYDVIDHTQVAAGLGGRAGFEKLAQVAREHGLGIIVDVVPNHMALVAPEYVNRPFWQVLKDGRDAPTATWFDVDWKSGGGRIGLPVLGDTLEAVLERGELTLESIELDGVSEPVLRYHDHVFPLALGTEPARHDTPGMGQAEDESSPPANDGRDIRKNDDSASRADAPVDIRAILDRQHYRLASWRDKRDVLNYRRFFEVDQLIAVRVELPEVFDATHELLLDLNQRGLIDGFRIDHPDGLADPAGYLERLRRSCRRGTYVWVEKILEASEELPKDWACDGTTGYDAMQAIQAALVDTAASGVLTRIWQQTGAEATIEQTVEQAKRQVVRQSLAPEVERLTRRAREALPDLDPERIRQAVIELLVAGEVYRAYVRPDERLSEQARERLTEAFARALRNRDDLTAELHALIPLAAVADEDNPAALDFAVRLQQTWGPVMAKGIEDTTFYRWHRLVALNEVGGDPQALDTGSPQVLHDWAERQQRDWPNGMTALSTHDTKRSEDVRARLLAVAGDPDAWQRCSSAAQDCAARFGVDAPTAHLVWQTLLGVGEISDERIDGYLVKALREAKQRTGWTDGDPQYEDSVLKFTAQMRREGPLREAIEAALTANADAVRATVLAAKTLALTIPGVPDTYQGCEVVDLSLVDPDNRRPVDFTRRNKLLADVDGPSPLLIPEVAGPTAAVPPPARVTRDLDAAKQWVVSRVLRLRRSDPELFGAGSSYTPMGATTNHALGFVRSFSPGRIAGVLGLGRRQLAVLVTRAPSRLARNGGWAEHTVVLPDGEWQDILCGRRVDGGPQACQELLADLPVSVLVQG